MTKSLNIPSRFGAELTGQLLAAISSGLLIFLLARLLAPNEYGILFLAISVLTIVQLFAKLGVPRSTARFISEYKESNPAQVPHIIRTGAGTILVTISIVGLGLVATDRYLVELIGEPRLSVFFQLGVLFLIFFVLTRFVQIVLQGFEANKLSVTVHVIDRLGRLVFACSLAYLGFNAIGAFIGFIISLFLATVVGTGFIYFYILRGFRRSRSPEAGLSRRIVEYSFPLTATDIGNVVDKEVDTILVGFFLTPVAVSYYVIGKQVNGLLIKPVTALGYTLSPTFGAEKGAGNIARGSQIYEVAITNTLLVYLPSSIGLILIADPTIDLVFGNNYRGAIPVVQILALYLTLQAVTQITNGALDYLGRARARAVAKGITSILNVLLNIYLIPRIGVVGAAIATVLTHSLYTIVVVYLIHLEFKLHAVSFIKDIASIVGITFAMSLPILLLLDYIEGWVTLVMVILISAGIWGTLSALTGFIRPKQVLTKLQ